ncbi:ABC transporter substrate-binding protein [Candidatus Magnetoovum chiemensis]|nr:ABC transporter substrate-binding protein [Candidatus Magnetoovum chiemensis]
MKIKITSIAKKNIKRKAFRSAAIALSVMIVSATLFAITTVMDSVETSLKRSTERLGADIIAVPAGSEQKAQASLLSGEPSTFYMDKTIEDKIKTITGVKTTAVQLYLKTSQYRCCDVGDMLLIGFEPEHDFTIMPWLTEKLNKKLSDFEAVMGRSLTAFQIGSKITTYGQDFTVTGMLERTGMKFIDNSVFLPMTGIRKIVEMSKEGDREKVNILENQISTVLIQVKPDTNAQRVAIHIEYEIPGIKAIVAEDIISAVRKQLFLLLRGILSVSIILWIMSLFLIAVVFSMIVNERQREIGLLRAMGAKKTDIFKLIMNEASMLSIIGGILGIIFGGAFLYFFSNFIKNSLNVPYLWPEIFDFILLICLCLFLSFLTGAIAALYPAVKSMNMEPYAAIRKGE